MILASRLIWSKVDSCFWEAVYIFYCLPFKGTFAVYYHQNFSGPVTGYGFLTLMYWKNKKLRTRKPLNYLWSISPSNSNFYRSCKFYSVQCLAWTTKIWIKHQHGKEDNCISSDIFWPRAMLAGNHEKIFFQIEQKNVHWTKNVQENKKCSWEEKWSERLLWYLMVLNGLLWLYVALYGLVQIFYLMYMAS